MGKHDRCCVGGCNNDKRYKEKYVIHGNVKSGKLIFHRFPFGEPNRQAWTQQVLRGRRFWKPGNYAYVCSNHFVDGKPTDRNPVPTLFMSVSTDARTPTKRKSPIKRKLDTDMKAMMESCINISEETEALVSNKLQASGKDCVNTTSNLMNMSKHGTSPNFAEHGYSKSPDEIKTKSPHVNTDVIKLSFQKRKRKRKKMPVFNDDYARISLLDDDEEYIPSLSKSRREFCPSLTQKQIYMLLSFLDNPKNYLHDSMFLTSFISCHSSRLSSYAISNQLQVWMKILSKRKVNGVEMLCLQHSKKLILPKEKYNQIIEEAHLGTGAFIWSTISRDEKGVAQHNSYYQTFKLIETDYGVGDKEFGMDRYQIYEFIANCKGCSYTVKKLPPITKVLPTTSNLSLPPAEMNTPIDGNESDHIDLTNAPMTMLRPPPATGSVWFDQKGLASEKNTYKKLLGVINELGLELGALAQGDSSTKDRFMTKLYCADRFVKEIKQKVTSKEVPLNTNNLLQDYLLLQQEYVKMGKMDLFLYDVNILAIKYNLTKNATFMRTINDCVHHFNKSNDVIKKIQSNISVKPKNHTQSNQFSQRPLSTSSTNIVSGDLTTSTSFGAASVARVVLTPGPSEQPSAAYKLISSFMTKESSVSSVTPGQNLTYLTTDTSASSSVESSGNVQLCPASSTNATTSNISSSAHSSTSNVTSDALVVSTSSTNLVSTSADSHKNVMTSNEKFKDISLGKEMLNKIGQMVQKHFASPKES